MHVVLWDTRKLDVAKDFAGVCAVTLAADAMLVLPVHRSARVDTPSSSPGVPAASAVPTTLGISAMAPFRFSSTSAAY